MFCCQSSSPVFLLMGCRGSAQLCAAAAAAVAGMRLATFVRTGVCMYVNAHATWCVCLQSVGYSGHGDVGMSVLECNNHTLLSITASTRSGAQLQVQPGSPLRKLLSKSHQYCIFQLMCCIAQQIGPDSLSDTTTTIPYVAHSYTMSPNTASHHFTPPQLLHFFLHAAASPRVPSVRCALLVSELPHALASRAHAHCDMPCTCHNSLPSTIQSVRKLLLETETGAASASLMA